MAKLSELIKCLEEGGQVRYVSPRITQKWFNKDLSHINIVGMSANHELYEMREAPPKPKEVTFRAWMDKDNINSDRCLDSWEVDFGPKQSGRHYTEVEITIKEVV